MSGQFDMRRYNVGTTGDRSMPTGLLCCRCKPGRGCWMVEEMYMSVLTGGICIDVELDCFWILQSLPGEGDREGHSIGVFACDLCERNKNIAPRFTTEFY